MDGLHLEVEDRGIGLPLEKVGGVRRGLGMVAMRERAELLGGSIVFESPVFGGTLVRLKVPREEILVKESPESNG